jgi:hypothetical protein
MYHTITPVTGDHSPIIIEQPWSSQIILFNAGPGTVQAQIWTDWSGRKDGNFPSNAYEPNYSLELRAGNERIIGGAFVRVKLSDVANVAPFAAIGTRFINRY